MPISHDLRTIFIHIPKNAGESVEKALGMFGSNHWPNMDKLYGIVDTNIVLQHLTSSEVKMLLSGSECFEDYFKFAIVRNPWDRAVSEFNWYLRYGPRCTFDQWVEGLEHRIAINTMIHPYEIAHNIPQYKFIYDDEGGLLVDYVARFENLEQEFEIIREKLSLKVKLGHSQSTKSRARTHYHDYYNEKTKKIIQKLYQRDVDEFHYEY